MTKFSYSVVLSLSLLPSLAHSADLALERFLESRPALSAAEDTVLPVHHDTSAYPGGKLGGEMVKVSWADGALMAEGGFPRFWREVKNGFFGRQLPYEVTQGPIRCDFKLGSDGGIGATQLSSLSGNRAVLREGSIWKLAGHEQAYDRDRLGRAVFIIRFRFQRDSLSSLSRDTESAVYKSGLTCLSREVPFTVSSLKAALAPVFRFSGE